MSKFYLNVDSVFVMPICFSICKQQNLKKKIDDKQKMTKEYIAIYEQKAISKKWDIQDSIIFELCISKHC